MAFSLDSISRGKARRAPRIILAGTQKVGKSTLASQAPAPIFIPIKGEEGIDEIDCASFPAVTKFEELAQAVIALAEGSHDYQTVVIDSMTSLEPLIWRKACEDNGNAASVEKIGGGYGKGYIEALKYWREVQDALDFLRERKGMASILIAHVKVKTFNDPTTDPYDRYQIDLHDRASALFERWADAILFGNFKAFAKTVAQQGDRKTVHAIGQGDRFLFTQQRPSHFGGNRYSLPYELPFDGGKLFEAIANSQQATPADVSAN